MVRQKLGVILYDEHVFLIPKRLDLGKCFTITFLFYNPVPNTEKFHTLLQDSSGLGGLIVIDSTRKKIGTFTIDGDFIDSGFDLGGDGFDQKWLFFSFSYQRTEESTKIFFNLDGKKENLISEGKILIPNNIQFIGNSKDLDEPFGALCDLRIYKNFYVSSETLARIRNPGNKFIKIENEITDDIFTILYKKGIIEQNLIKKFLTTKDISEETFLNMIKFINNFMSKTSFRNQFLNYDLITKVLMFFNSKKLEVKKEISKFIQSIK